MDFLIWIKYIKYKYKKNKRFRKILFHSFVLTFKVCKNLLKLFILNGNQIELGIYHVLSFIQSDTNFNTKTILNSVVFRNNCMLQVIWFCQQLCETCCDIIKGWTCAIWLFSAVLNNVEHNLFISPKCTFQLCNSN